jgi:cytochrome c oxidase subunit II
MRQTGRINGTFLMCAVLACTFSAMSCGGMQSALDPAGSNAESIAKLWWLFFYTCSGVFILVIFALVLAVLKGRKARLPAIPDSLSGAIPVLEPPPNAEQKRSNVIKAAVGATVVILFVFLVASFITGRAISPARADQQTLMIEVTGQQWWWQARYIDSNPSNVFTTANEIHIPVGRPVLLTLSAHDVIHSFWVPNLAGKKDLIPGKNSSILFKADRPGTFRGQCAEYCGLQHARMALYIIAEPPEKFAEWLNAQRQPAASPSTESEKKGQQVFMTSPCIMCHTIQGTSANAMVGPDLTHLASRFTIAAATVPNTRGHLGGWVIDSQTIKPGNHMPPNNLNSEELQSLLDYLQSLK